MAVYTPNLQLVRYTGETPRKLWEIKARSIPTLNKGDSVLLDATTAVLMVKKYGFEMGDNSKLTFGESVQSEAETVVVLEEEFIAEEEPFFEEEIILEDIEVEEYKLPLASEIMNLSNDEVKRACKYVGIATNKKIDNLKSLLLPYLPQE